MLTTKNAVKTASYMIIATLTAKILGMARDILFAGYYGTGSEAVAFLAAVRIPLLFFDIGLGAAISSTFIPVFNRYLEKEGKKQAIDFSNHFVNFVLCITGIFTLVGMIFAKQLVYVIAPGLQKETFDLTVRLVRILFPMIGFTGLAFSFVGILQSFNEFNIPASISLVSNIIVIIYLFLLNKSLGVFGLAVAMLVGWLSQVLVQIPSLIKKGYKYRPILSFQNDGIREVIFLALPVLISTWVQPINTMVNIRLASYLNQGEAVAALDYANKVYIIIVGVFTYAISNLIFPSLSRLSISENKEQFAKLVNDALRTVTYFIFPIMVGFIVLRVPLIRLIYQRGAFDASSTQLTSTALLFYSIGMVGFAAHEMLNKGFYALHDAATPMKIAAGGIILNILLSITFVYFTGAGIAGLALAASIASIVIASLLLIAMQKKVKGIVNTQMMHFTIKVVLASAIMGAVVLAVRFVLDGILGITLMDKMMHLGIPTLAGLSVYVAVSLILGIEEANIALNMIKEKVKRM